MEKVTIEIVKNIMIGQTSGHMATIPNNPLLYSIIQVYGSSKKIHDDDAAFEAFILDLAEGIKLYKQQNLVAI